MREFHLLQIVKRLGLASVMALLLITGCTRATPGGSGVPEPNDAPESPLARDQYDYVLLIAVDKSTSFVDLMKPGGRAFEFMNKTISSYFHHRISNNDYLIVSVLSGSRQSIVWTGAPGAIRADFTKMSDFGEFLDQKSDAAGSRIWDGLADCLDLAMSDPTIWNPRTRVIMIALTDMECNLVDNYTSEQRLLTAFKKFADHGGQVGLYFVGQRETFEWRTKLRECGFKNPIVEPATTTQPPLPNFE
jgi:hypothetical protein